MRHSELHLSQQRVHRHRRPALDPRHFRELLSRTGDGKSSRYDRPRAHALDDHPRGVFTQRRQGAAITAKDKLRQQLGKDMNFAGGCINFSSEKADKCSKRENGIENVLELVGMPLPDMYSPELSLFVLEAGIKVLETEKPLITYLSLTDYIQHKYAPGEPEADRYYRDMDALFGRIHDLGAVVGLVADHGMRAKSNADGSPKVVWLQDALDLEFGKDATTVICPITDYFVAHHGSLGSFVRVYCHRDATPE